MEAKRFLEAVLTMLGSSNTVRVTKMNDDLIVQGDEGEVKRFTAEQVVAMQREGPVKDQRYYEGPCSDAMSEAEMRQSLNQA